MEVATTRTSLLVAAGSAAVAGLLYVVLWQNFACDLPAGDWRAPEPPLHPSAAAECVHNPSWMRPGVMAPRSVEPSVRMLSAASPRGELVFLSAASLPANRQNDSQTSAHAEPIETSVFQQPLKLCQFAPPPPAIETPATAESLSVASPLPPVPSPPGPPAAFAPAFSGPAGLPMSPSPSGVGPGYTVPVWQAPGDGSVDIQTENGRISLIARQAPLSYVVAMLAQSQKRNIVCGPDVNATVSIVLRDVLWTDALSAVLGTAGFAWAERNGIVHVTSVTSGKGLPPDIQGRALQVFPLDFASGEDVEKAVKGLLSPVGQVFYAPNSPTDLRKPKDCIVVEDLPGYLARTADLIKQIDNPPRQVLIEAHVFEIVLEDNARHGVNFTHLFQLSGNTVELEMTGMANPLAPQAFFARVGGGNLDALIECLKTTTDAKTLASPRVLVTDGQQARIQVGEQLGYRVTTTTETSTMENVQFLDLGVVLEVTPHISRDGRVLMKVMPKVSTGRINPDTELPEEKTSQVESNVYLEDGQGIVIGGLIQENDSNIQSKIAFLGDLWLIGALFQRRQIDKGRTEIVVALVPHVQPTCCSEVSLRNEQDLSRCQTSLFDGPLVRVPRPFDAQLPDCLRMPPYPWEESIESPPGATIVGEGGVIERLPQSAPTAAEPLLHDHEFVVPDESPAGVGVLNSSASNGPRYESQPAAWSPSYRVSRLPPTSVDRRPY